MASLIQLFIKICFLKAGPQDLPTSAFLSLLLAGVGLVTGTIVVLESYGVFGSAFMMQLMDLALVAGALKVALLVVGKSERFYQSISALFGTGVLINLASLPLLFFMPESGGETSVNGLGLWGLAYLLLVFWALTIGAHIVRHTFEIPFAFGVVVSVGYFLVINSLVQTLFAPGAI